MPIQTLSLLIAFQGLEFLDAVLKVWKWRTGIDTICHEWLKLLLDLINLEEIGAAKLLCDIFDSGSEVVLKHKPFIVDQVCDNVIYNVSCKQ